MIYVLPSTPECLARNAWARTECAGGTQTMTASSTVRQVTVLHATSFTRSSGSVREYRRHRKHLFPLAAYKTAAAIGGNVSAYCGIVQAVPKGSPADIEEVAETGPEDCVTCADLWLGRNWVRL